MNTGRKKGLMELCKNRSTYLRRLFLFFVVLTATFIAFAFSPLTVTEFRTKLQQIDPYQVVFERTSIQYTVLDTDTGQRENNSYFAKDQSFMSRYVKHINSTANHVVSTYCGVTYSKHMDLLSQGPVKGLPQFKNPCWYENKIFRCFPYFFIVGASKTGTSDLYNRLLQHPHYVNTKEKEPNWFSQKVFSDKMTLTQYLTKFYHSAAQGILQDYKNARERNESYFSSLITGDSSTTYLFYHDFWPIMPGNYNQTEPVFTNADYIYNFNPRAKIIFSVRNPIDRLWSGFLYTSKGDKSAEMFHKVVVEGTRVYRECFKNRSIRSCVYDRKIYLRSTFERTEASPSWKCPLNSMHFKTNIHLRIGLYSVFIKDYLKVFPRDQIFIQRLEDRSKDMDKSMSEIYKFLEMDQLSSTKMKEVVGLSKVNVNSKGHSRYGDMKNETRRILYEFYKPFNEELASIMGQEKLNYGIQG